VQEDGYPVALIDEFVADKGYHSNESMELAEEMGLRGYVSEPDRGRRRWKDKADAQAAVYANRRRVRGKRGRRLMRQRGERIERTFAHCYETGGMRRVHLRGHPNILKRLLVHGAGYNLALAMRKLCGAGVPRAWANLARAMKRSIRGICQPLGRIIQSGVAATRIQSRIGNIPRNHYRHSWAAAA